MQLFRTMIFNVLLIPSLALYLGTVIVLAASSFTGLYQRDFDNGTVIITQPGLYVLQEDITFEPNGGLNESYPELSLFPTSSQRAPDGEYSGRGFALGFFAAIVIDGEDIVLDLNGFTLQQSILHHASQRFYANIELSNAPFTPNTGPAHFSTLSSFKFSRNVTVGNGVLGRSSHHGVHCNNCEEVVFRDLVIEEFEVAGVLLNAAKGITMENVTVQNSKRDIRFNGRFSQAIFILQAFSVWIEPFLDQDIINELNSYDGNNIVDHVYEKFQVLRAKIYDVLQGTIDGAPIVDDGLFASLTNGLPDGSILAGIMIHPKSNVLDFADTLPDPEIFENVNESDLVFGTKDVVLIDVAVRNLAIKPTEKTILTVNASIVPSKGMYAAAGALTDMVGAVLDFDSVRDLLSDSFSSKGNALFDFQIAMAKLALLIASAAGDIDIDPSVLRLAKRSKTTQQVIDWYEGRLSWPNLITLPGYAVANNHDFMFHMCKGVIGIKVDETLSALLENITIEDLENQATDRERSYFFRNLAVANTLANRTGIEFITQENINISSVTIDDAKYTGFGVKGLTLAATINVTASDIIVQNLFSNVRNDIIGVDFINRNADSLVAVTTSVAKTNPSLHGVLPTVSNVMPYVKADEFSLLTSCVQDSVVINEDNSSSLKIGLSLGMAFLLIAFLMLLAYQLRNLRKSEVSKDHELKALKFPSRNNNVMKSSEMVTVEHTPAKIESTILSF